MKTYIVEIKEVHTSRWLVEADSPEAAKNRAMDHGEELCSIEYSHSLDQDTWTVKEQPLCIECHGANDDNPEGERCQTCQDWFVQGKKEKTD